MDFNEFLRITRHLHGVYSVTPVLCGEMASTYSLHNTSDSGIIEIALPDALALDKFYELATVMTKLNYFVASKCTGTLQNRQFTLRVLPFSSLRVDVEHLPLVWRDGVQFHLFKERSEVCG